MADPYNPGGVIPPDQVMLLKLIDAKFETAFTKFDGLAASLNAITQSMAASFARYDDAIDGVVVRVSAIEKDMEVRKHQVKEFEALKATVSDLTTWKVSEQTTSKNTIDWIKAAWTVGGASVTGFIIWLVASYSAATAPQNGQNGGTKTHIEINDQKPPVRR